MKITIGEIARVAGVSKGTVSRVINDKTTVAGSTREQVLAVMKRLGYVPDPVARELSKRSQHTLGIWVGAGENKLSPYFSLIWRALMHEMQQRATQFVELPTDISHDHRWLDAVLIFSCSDIENRMAQLRGRNVPVVLIGKHPSVSCVAPDDRGGGRLAAERILAKGHRRILHLTLTEDSQWVLDRVSGFRAALDHAGVPEADAPVVRGEGSVLGGYRLMRAAWNQGLRPSAVFAATDEMAIGALGALADLGVSVPGEVSMVGFDGFKELCPALASVAQDIPAIAHAAVSLALEAIDRHTVHRKLVPVTFVDGSTLGPAPLSPP